MPSGNESVQVGVASAASRNLHFRWEQAVPESGAPVEFAAAQSRIERDVEDTELSILVGPDSLLRIDEVECVPQADHADRAYGLATVSSPMWGFLGPCGTQLPIGVSGMRCKLPVSRMLQPFWTASG